MSSTQTLLCAAVALVLVASVSAFFDGEPRQVFCKGQEVKNNPVFRQNMKTCVEEFKAAKMNKMAGERKRGKNCIVLCALTKDGLFDDKGAFQKPKMISNIEASLPADLAKTLVGEMETCITQTKIEAVTSDPTDYLCKAYKPFFKCTFIGWMKTCVEGFDPEVWSDDE